MEKKIFAQTVQSAVQEKLGREYEVILRDIIKNNGVTLSGLIITAQGQNIAPTIYLDSFHEAYEGGVSLDCIVEKVLEIYGKDSPPESIDMEFFRDFEKVKDKICYKLINREKNEELLLQIPHREFLDLEICFYYAYQGDEIGNGTILIYNTHLEMWGTSVEELFALSQKNTPALFPWECKSMEETLREFLKEDREDKEELSETATGGTAEEEACVGSSMRILCNSAHIYGAACILYPGVLEETARERNGDLYILPSSVHEVILLEVDGEKDPEILKEMIKEVNDTQVRPEEILSYQLYYFDCTNNNIRIF